VETLGAWLPILGIILIFWLLLIRPAQRRQKQLNSLQDALAVGDPVLTSAGIFGTVARIDNDKVGIEVADGVVITVARGAIVGLVKETEPEPDAVEQPESDREQEQE
jgi:preprotein translocase subunit YajC